MNKKTTSKIPCPHCIGGYRLIKYKTHGLNNPHMYDCEYEVCKRCGGSGNQDGLWTPEDKAEKWMDSVETSQKVSYNPPEQEEEGKAGKYPPKHPNKDVADVVRDARRDHADLPLYMQHNIEIKNDLLDALQKEIKALQEHCIDHSMYEYSTKYIRLHDVLDILEKHRNENTD